MPTHQEVLPPGDLHPAEFRAVGMQVIDAIAAYHAALPARRVLPDVRPAEVAAQFADGLPELGELPAELVADWRERVEPLLMAVGSPRHFGYVNGSGAMIGIFAEALAAGTNTNAGAWNLGPAATEIERQSLRWICDLIGYPSDAGGLFVSGGTMANFTALLAALRNVAPYDSTKYGLQTTGRTGRFLLYMSDHEGHVSVVRVADMLNLGRDCIRLVPSRADFTMDVTALERMVAADRAAGDHPFCVVAQLGSVNVGAIDPLDAIADICAKYGLWLHGDGACGLLAAALPEMRHRFEGIERADSLSFDAHKWLGVPYDCGAVLVREGERLRRAFSIHAPYLRTSFDDAERGLDYLEYGPEMSRPFRALKVWMALRHLGAAGLRTALAKNLDLARHLHGLVADHPDFEVLHEPTLYLYSFRYVPDALADRKEDPEVRAYLDQLNQHIADSIQRSGLAFLMTTRIHGRVALRMSICSQRTFTADIDATFDAIARVGRRMTWQNELSSSPTA